MYEGVFQCIHEREIQILNTYISEGDEGSNIFLVRVNSLPSWEEFVRLHLSAYANLRVHILVHIRMQ